MPNIESAPRRQLRKPHKVGKAARSVAELHYLLDKERSRATAAAREAHLRSLMSSPKLSARMSAALAKAKAGSPDDDSGAGE
jgi:hypothetical protein